MSVVLNTKHLSSFINEEEYKAIYPQVEAAHNQLEAKNGPGNDFLGWMYLPRDYDKEEFARIKEAAKKIREDSEVLVVAGVAALAQWLLSVCNNRITFSVSRDLRNEALRKIQTLPLSYLDSHPSGDIVSRMVADVDTFADGLLMGFTQLFSGVLTILGTLLFMLRENVPITLVVVCITPLSLVVASFLAKRSYKYFQSQSTVRGEQTALVNETR